MEKPLEKLKDWVAESGRIVFFGGAGVSTESGIPDFRSEDGLYRQSYRYPPETILSRSFFERHPEEFFAFYRDKMLFPEAKPNPVHRRLAECEQAGRLAAVVTQNIDGLHQAAGSRRVLELHGSVHRNTCLKCHARYDLNFILGTHGVPRCPCGGIIKPDVVLYEESLDEAVLQGAVEAISSADLLIVGGTSLAVYPAAGLLRYYRGNRLVLINRSVTPYDDRADLLFQCGLGETLAQLDGII